MTIDPRYLELMHAEIDRVNSERQSAELRSFLATSQEGQVEFARLGRLSETLDRVEPAEPPADLKDVVMTAVRRSAGPGVVRGVRFGRTRPSMRTLLGYGYAAAAGLLLGIAVRHWPPFGAGEGRAIDPSDLAGTMTRLEPDASAPLRQIGLDAPGIEGTARVRPTEAGYTIELDLDSQEPVRVVLRYDAREMGFRGFAQDIEAVQGLQADRAEIAWTQSGHHRLAVVMTPRTAAESSMDLALLVSGKVARSEPIPLPGMK